MKKHLMFHCRMTGLARLGLLGGLGLLMGCDTPSPNQPTETKPASSAQAPSTPSIQPLPPGVTLRPDKNIDGVWVAEGFDFKGFSTINVMPPVFAAIERSNEADMRAMAMKVLPEELANRFRDTRLFKTVDVAKMDSKVNYTVEKRLETTIIEYEQGGNTARLLAGVFGGGQPVIKVRGRIFDGDKLECVFEVKRSGASADARAIGRSMSNEDIQRDDIHDLAISVADLFRRIAKIQ